MTITLVLSVILVLSLRANIRHLCNRLNCLPRRLPEVLWRHAKWYRRRVALIAFDGTQWGEGEIVTIKSRVDVGVWVGADGGYYLEPAGWKLCDRFFDRLKPSRTLTS